MWRRVGDVESVCVARNVRAVREHLRRYWTARRVETGDCVKEFTEQKDFRIRGVVVVEVNAVPVGVNVVRVVCRLVPDTRVDVANVEADAVKGDYVQRLQNFKLTGHGDRHSAACKVHVFIAFT